VFYGEDELLITALYLSKEHIAYFNEDIVFQEEMSSLYFTLWRQGKMIIGALHANEEDTCSSDIFMEINLYIL